VYVPKPRSANNDPTIPAQIFLIMLYSYHVKLNSSPAYACFFMPLIRPIP
jgi:hypothetical protein